MRPGLNPSLAGTTSPTISEKRLENDVKVLILLLLEPLLRLADLADRLIGKSFSLNPSLAGTTSPTNQ